MRYRFDEDSPHADASHHRPLQRRALDPGRTRGGQGRRQRGAVHPRRDDRADRLHDGPARRRRLRRGDRARGGPPRRPRPGRRSTARHGARRCSTPPRPPRTRGGSTRLHATGLLDSDISPSFDRLARLAASVLHAPVALVSLVDADRQFFKSCLGMPEPWASERGSPLTHSFCQHAVASREPLLVSDAREHEVLRDNLAIRDMGVVAYAGIPLIDSGGPRPRDPLRDRQPAAPLDEPPGPAPQRHRRLRGHRDRARAGRRRHGRLAPAPASERPSLVRLAAPGGRRRHASLEG